jgi:hypothetical protein
MIGLRERQSQDSDGRQVGCRASLRAAASHGMTENVELQDFGWADARFGAGFRTPALRDGRAGSGPAFESLPRRKPRAERALFRWGAIYGDLRIADGASLSRLCRVATVLAARAKRQGAFGRGNGRAWRRVGGRRRTGELVRTSASCSGAVEARGNGVARREGQRRS